MNDSQRLLEFIEEGIVAHGADLGGWTRLDSAELKLFDGRVTLSATISELDRPEPGQVHAHVLTTLHDYDDEVLDACLVGMSETREGALREAAFIWITCVAGPIKSFLDQRPVCTTVQTGVTGGDIEQGFSPDDFGFSELHGYVGPILWRGMPDDTLEEEISGAKPWFRHAVESAAPRRVHLAKATIFAEGERGWRRELEIDGHDVAHSDPLWPANCPAPPFAYFFRFAVFAFPDNSPLLREREELDRAILRFAEQIAAYENIDELMAALVAEGFSPYVVQQIESLSTLAFGRVYFEPYGVKYPPHIFRARGDGRVETEVPLMSLPPYSRARALTPRLRQTLSDEHFQRLCFYSAESGAILQACEASHAESMDWEGLKMYPCVVPDPDVDEATMQRALNELKKLTHKNTNSPRLEKPWWKIW